MITIVKKNILYAGDIALLFPSAIDLCYIFDEYDVAFVSN